MKSFKDYFLTETVFNEPSIVKYEPNTTERWPISWGKMYVNGQEIFGTYASINVPGRKPIYIMCPAYCIRGYGDVENAFFTFEDPGHWATNAGLKRLVDRFNNRSERVPNIKPDTSNNIRHINSVSMPFESLVKDGHFKLITRDDAKRLGFDLLTTKRS